MKTNTELTIRALLIGALGSFIITASSLYVALRLGALPWPTIFVAILSMGLLKMLGKTNLREINVAHTAMSAGAMVAGGLAFTMPALWILDPESSFNFVSILAVSLGGTVLGLAATALIRKYYIETEKDQYPFPIGVAAYETLKAGDKKGYQSLILFVTMGASGLFTALRDVWGKIPPVLMVQKWQEKHFTFGFWVSPMALGIGYIIGPLYTGVWILGALIGFGLIIPVGVSQGWFPRETVELSVSAADAFRRSLGIGLMVGTGLGVLIRGILPRLGSLLSSAFGSSLNNKGKRLFPLAAAVITALALQLTTDLGIIASLLVIAGAWLAAIMAASLTGQTGINPMEILGILVLLAVKAFFPMNASGLVAAAAVTAIAAGLAGDMMNDYRVGALVGTNPRSQRIAETLGGLLGAVISTLVLYLFVKAYGPLSLGDPAVFPAPQARAVAAMAGGIPAPLAFAIGAGAGILLFIFKVPAMTLGLGIYLPMIISGPVFLGGLILVLTRWIQRNKTKNETGKIIASGLLGGEAVTGVILAFAKLVSIS